jgi:hypothetical protein
MLTQGKINIWRYDVLRATIACLNDGLKCSVVRFIPTIF